MLGRTAPARPAYPTGREVDVVLRDGGTAHVRPVRPEDEGALLAFLRELSDQSRAFRFFSAAANLERAAQWAAAVNYEDVYGLLVTTGEEERIIGHAAYARESADRAEVAFAIADAHHGRGLATILLAHLAEAAQQCAIAVFEASVLPENHKMLEVFRESGCPVEVRAAPGELALELPTSLSASAIERFERRDQLASIAAVRSLLAPRTVAVVGASRRRGTVGGELLHNIVENGFQGVVYPVNPNADAVQSMKAYGSVRDTPTPVELAVIAVPAEAVLGVARDCAAAGVRSLLVISAGFSEAGEEGAERQRALVGLCRTAGMRLVGPNCLGVINTAADVRLNATFTPRTPVAGGVGFLSQSGGLGIAIIDAANTLGVGLSSFVSAGNKADISGNDLLPFWEQDASTEMVLLYLESFGNPRKFARLARRLGRRKPIAAVKSGRSAAGARATGSHTGALLAASDVTVDALFAQAGVIRTDSLSELFDVASLLSSQPVPGGNRVGIVTNAGGPGILCADACESSGLDVVALSEQVRGRLGELLARETATGNPVDMLATATADQYRLAIETLAASGEVDAIVVVFIQPLVTQAASVARAIREAASELPVAAVFMTATQAPGELRGADARVPAFAFPEDAARALGHAARYGRWREEPEGERPHFDDLRPEEGAAIVADALATGREWLSPDAVRRLLGCYGLPLVQTRIAADAEQAARAAAELGRPVALKATGPGIVHKSELHAVALDLQGAEDVRDAAREMLEGLRRRGVHAEGLVVQPMVAAGVEVLVGVTHDPRFGPLLACGVGGVATELVNDVAARITPVTDRDAAHMLRSLATFPLLDGYRGAPRCDVDALEEVLLRVGALVDHHPEVAEMDCNPVVVSPGGATIIDARVRVLPVAPAAPMPSLQA